MEITFRVRTNVRSAPTLTSTVLRVADKGTKAEMLVTDAVNASGYRWRKLLHPDGLEGWSAEGLFWWEWEKFQEAFRFTLAWEGGYVNDPNDPGGETKYGISKRSYPHLDIKNLTIEKAMEIYHDDYWVRSTAYQYAEPTSTIIFDIAVLSGVGRAIGLGSYTPLEIVYHQLKWLTGLSNFTHFGRGWTRRTCELLRMLL